MSSSQSPCISREGPGVELHVVAHPSTEDETTHRSRQRERSKGPGVTTTQGTWRKRGLSTVGRRQGQKEEENFVLEAKRGGTSRSEWKAASLTRGRELRSKAGVPLGHAGPGRSPATAGGSKWERECWRLGSWLGRKTKPGKAVRGEAGLLDGKEQGVGR